MTSRELAALNRRTRILKRIREGVPYEEIARAEGVSSKRVSQIGNRHGIRVSAEVHREHVIESWRLRMATLSLQREGAD